MRNYIAHSTNSYMYEGGTTGHSLFQCHHPTVWSSTSGGSKNRNPRNPPKFTKSNVYINQIPPSATKSTYMNRKLSKSNISSHEINGFHEIQYTAYEIHAFA